MRKKTSYQYVSSSRYIFLTLNWKNIYIYIFCQINIFGVSRFQLVDTHIYFWFDRIVTVVAKSKKGSGIDSGRQFSDELQKTLWYPLRGAAGDNSLGGEGGQIPKYISILPLGKNQKRFWVPMYTSYVSKTDLIECINNKFKKEILSFWYFLNSKHP